MLSPRGQSGLGLGLGLEVLASFNITASEQIIMRSSVGGRINCCIPSVRPSVSPFRISEFLEIVKPWKLQM